MSSDGFTLTNIIVGITCIISFLSLQHPRYQARMLFHPLSIKREQQWYRFVSSGLIHADGWHLLINMFVLWSFGNAVEQLYYPAFLGSNSGLKFLILYIGGIIVASIPSYLRHQDNPNYSALGASGGVSAVVFAVILFAPWQNLYLYGVIAIPQILAGVAYLAYSWHQNQHSNDNIGHMAHFTGALWGFFFTGLLNTELFSRFIQLSLDGPSWL